MDAHPSTRRGPLNKHWTEGDTGGSKLPTRVRRSRLREERHPNAETAPPIHRGSMPPRPWRGFWNSVLAWGAASEGGNPRATERPAPWQQAASRRRKVFALFTLLSAVIATRLFMQAQPDDGQHWLHLAQALLFAVLSTWVVTGFVTALMGFWVTLRGDPHSISARKARGKALAPEVRTAVIMPICNEDVATVFAGLRATCESLAATGHARQFDFFVLSDTPDPALAAAERAAWAQLREGLAEHPEQPQPEVYYRLRKRRTHRKAGNVADFCRRWGKDYRYMLVLDADSVMSGDCIVTLAKLMEAHPRAGIIQTATQAVGHDTLHARAQQFASRVTGRLFTLGMQFWQLGASHYWGHNAILRVEPFMAHCALAPIAGQGGLCGPIMSHDFVEAALMRRAGWEVWLVSDLAGSYEQQPPDLLSELQRDRRWCQGNLQNARLIAEPGLDRTHRFMFGVGAMSYLSAPLWLAFMTLGTALWLASARNAPAWDEWVGWNEAPHQLLGLWAWTLCMLMLPRVLGLVAVFLRGEQNAFGGATTLLRGALLETVLAVLQAPIRMLAHSLFVAVALTGIKLDWKSPPREAAGLGWRESFARLAPLTGVVVVLACGVALIEPAALVTLVSVGVPLLLSVPLVVLTSHVGVGERLRASGWLLIPEESRSPRVLRRARHHALRAARRLRLA